MMTKISPFLIWLVGLVLSIEATDDITKVKVICELNKIAETFHHDMIYARNRKGPKLDPCGTPIFTKDPNENLTGVFVPVLSPFCDGQCGVNLAVIPRFTKFLAENKIDGIIVATTIEGESESMSSEEIMKTVKAYMKSAKVNNLKLIVQLPGQSSPDTLAVARLCNSRRVAILCNPVLRNVRKTTIQDVIDYLKFISVAAPSVPILFSYDPENIKINLDLAQFWLNATEQINNFSGVRCPLEDALRMSVYITTKRNQYIIVSEFYSLLAAIKAGFTSFVTIAANVFPKLAAGIKNNYMNTTGQEFQTTLNRNIRAVTGYKHYDQKLRHVRFFKTALKIIYGFQFGDARFPSNGTTRQECRDMTERLQAQGITCANPEY